MREPVNRSNDSAGGIGTGVTVILIIAALGVAGCIVFGVLKMFKKGSAKRLQKLLKGGQGAEDLVVDEPAKEGAARRRRGTRRASKSRRHAFLY